ncbi:hypothetical protein ACFPOE_13565 [Caenimonas terrae]|uniref:Uncharacterized protein n=1 Tax=Caenimonas terrae TaxID=696074 RepID=A0ABW0NDW7_9BURK
MRRTALLQTAAIAVVCALFAAKLPSLAEPGATAFSWVGAAMGACIAFFAGFIGSRFSSANPDFEASATPVQLRLLRGSVIGLAGAVTSFTAYLYFPSPWLKAIIGVSIAVGAACVFLSLVAKWAPAGRPDA